MDKFQSFTSPFQQNQIAQTKPVNQLSGVGNFFKGIANAGGNALSAIGGIFKSGSSTTGVNNIAQSTPNVTPNLNFQQPTFQAQPAVQPVAQATQPVQDTAQPVQISINAPTPQPIAQQTIPQPSIPSPVAFQPQIGTDGFIPSSSISSNATYADVLAKRNQYEEQYRRALQQASDVYGQGLQAVEQARYSGETSPFAQGQAERVQRNADLASLAATNRAEQFGKLLGVNQTNLQNALAQSPTSLGSNVNQATGDVYVTTRNPVTGATEVVKAGNVGTQKSFVSSSVNQDPYTGQLIFTGVRQDGTVETQNLSGGTTGGATGGMGQVPFAIQSAINYAGNTPFIDAGNLTSQQLPMAQSYAAQNGVPLLSKEDATKLKEASATFSSADSLLTTVEQYANKVVTATSPSGIPAQYLSTKLGSLFKTNPDAVLFDSSISAFSSLLTRAAGEKGVLTDKDVARIINGLPTRTDTVESATRKVQALRSIYQSVKDGTFNSYIGSRTPQAQSMGSNVIQTKVGAVDNSWFN